MIAGTQCEFMAPSSTINESETSAALLQSSTAKERNLVQVITTVGVHPYHCLKSESPKALEFNRLRALLDDVDAKQYISCIGRLVWTTPMAFQTKSVNYHGLELILT